jgi:hypothetical protein
MIRFRRPDAAVTICERCGQACTAGCRAQARRDLTRTQALTYLPNLR